MGILLVWLFHKSNPAKKIRVYALLDNASGGTFVNESAAKALGVEGSSTDLTLTTIHGTHSVTSKAVVVFSLFFKIRYLILSVSVFYSSS